MLSGARRASAVAALLLLALPAAGEAASGPPGPRLAFAVFRPSPIGEAELATIGPGGTDLFRLNASFRWRAIGIDVEGRPSWSADGSLFAFRGQTRSGQLAIFVARADGSHLRRIWTPRRAYFLGDPLVAPDGRSVVVPQIDLISGHFLRLSAQTSASRRSDEPKFRAAVWSISTRGRGRHLLIPWTRRLNPFFWPSSYSPDGRRLAGTRFSSRGDEAVIFNLRTRRMRVFARNVVEPTYSQDGRIIAVRNHYKATRQPWFPSVARSDLLVSEGASRRLRKVLSFRPGLAWPSWDPSGQRIAFTVWNERIRDLRWNKGNFIKEVNADGTCLRTIPHKRGFFGGAAWQPGPGREAGRIEC